MQIERIRIDNTDVFIEELGNGKGKITISDTYDHNYSYFWGAMGGTLKDFLCSINSSYFCDKLMGARSKWIMDVPKTFAAIRKYIATDMGLPWYQHMAFQKDLRETLKNFQSQIEEHPSNDLFVSLFHHSFINRLSFWYIEDSIDQKYVEKDFKGICEVWHFIVEKEGPEYIWLTKFHSKLKTAIKKELAVS